MHGGIDAGPVIAFDRATDQRVKLGDAVQHPALQLRHVGMRHALGLGKPVQRAEQPAQRVAQAAVEVGLLLEDVAADAHVLGGVGRHHPKPKNIGAELAGHLAGRGDVAERFRHLAALLVHDEAMGEHRLERRHAAGADRFQQRRMKPAAMLVGAFEIQIGRPGQAACFQHEGMGAATFEPDIDDVEHLFIGGGIAPGAEEAFRRRGVPGIGALGAENLDDAVHHDLVAQHLAGCLLDEHRDRHAPGALAADAPVGPAGDHRADAVAALVGNELGIGDGGERLGTDRIRPVHADEPLRRGAEDQRRARAPGMRVGMHQLAARQQPAGRGQRGADGIGGAIDMQPGEFRHPGVKGAVLADGIRHLDAVGPAQLEIFLAMARGDVDEAGAGLGGDVVRRIHRHVVVIAAPTHRVGADSAEQVTPLVDVHDMVGFDPRRRADLRQQGQRDQHALAGDGQRARVRAVDADQGVVDVLAEGDGAVARHGPRRGGPDHDRRTGQRGDRAGDDRKAHRDGDAGVVVIFDLGLGQRGFLYRRPHHRPQPAVQRAVHQEAADLARNRGLARQVHGGVAVWPVAEYAEAAELGFLDRHPVRGIGSAFGAEIEDRDGVLVLFLRPVLLLDLPFDRQAVAVPAWDIVGVEAAHLTGAVDDVLEDLVQRGADMQMAVRVRRAVMQDEFFAVFRGRAQLAPQVHRLPPGEHGRLLVRQVATHREAGGGQEDGAAIVAAGGRGITLAVGHGMGLARFCNRQGDGMRTSSPAL